MFIRRVGPALLIGICLGTLCAFFAITSPGDWLEEELGLVWLYRMRGPIEPPSNVIVVAINEESATELDLPAHPREWPRSMHAKLLNSLADYGARVVVFDMDFSRPQGSAEDALFAAALSRVQNAILFQGIETSHRFLSRSASGLTERVRIEKVRGPLPMLAAAAWGYGPFPLPLVSTQLNEAWAFVGETADQPTLPVLAVQALALKTDAFWDVLYRRAATITSATKLASDCLVPLCTKPVHEVARTLHRAFRFRWLESLFDAQKDTPNERSHASEFDLKIQREKIKAIYEGDSFYYLNFYGPPGTIRHISYYALVKQGAFNDTELTNQLKDSIIFIGYSDLTKPSSLDGFDTVFTSASGVKMSGVEVAATAFANLLTAQTLKPVSHATRAIIIALFGSLLATIVFNLPMRSTIPSVGAVTVAYTLVVQFAFDRMAIWLPIATPVALQIPLIWATGLAWQHVEAKRKQRSLEKEKHAIDAESQAKSDFLALMSHEIRTPLHCVSGLIELLDGTRLDGQQKELVNQVRRSAEGLIQLLNQTLDFSKIQAGELEIFRDEIDLRGLVCSPIEAFRPAAVRKGLELSVEIAEHVPSTIVTDGLRLGQILWNLVGNAVKFTDAGTISLTVLVERVDEFGQELTFAIADTGIGIPKERIEEIFRPFRQADLSTTSRLGGSGLGLPICSQLAVLLCGKITVRSAPGEGSVFTLRLPLAELVEPMKFKLDEGAIAANGLMDHAPTILAYDLKLPVAATILIAEDHPTNRLLIERQLSQMNVPAEYCANGEEAWKRILEDPPAILITDVRMPGLNGVELTHRIRSDGRFERMMIIGLTANLSKASIDSCVSAGMNFVLSKPLKLSDLKRALEAIGFRQEEGEDAENVAPDTSSNVLVSLVSDVYRIHKSPVFDVSNVIGAFGVLDDSVRKILRDFVDETSQNLLVMRNHATKRNSDELAREAHRIAGSCMYIGASRLGILCHALEDAATRSRWNSVDVAFPRIDRCLEQVREAINRL